jgi:8-amino-7-oxononanoate synthase
MSAAAGAVGGLLGEQAQDLQGLAARDRLRRLSPRSGVDFASNDYLGLAESGVLADAARAALDRGVAVGSGGSRLLRGNHDEHEALEAEAAAFSEQRRRCSCPPATPPTPRCWRPCPRSRTISSPML